MTINGLDAILAKLLGQAGFQQAQADHAGERSHARMSLKTGAAAYGHSAAIVYGGHWVVSDPGFQALWKDFVNEIEASDLRWFDDTRLWEALAAKVISAHRTNYSTTDTKEQPS